MNSFPFPETCCVLASAAEQQTRVPPATGPVPSFWWENPGPGLSLTQDRSPGILSSHGMAARLVSSSSHDTGCLPARGPRCGAAHELWVGAPRVPCRGASRDGENGITFPKRLFLTKQRAAAEHLTADCGVSGESLVRWSAGDTQSRRALCVLGCGVSHRVEIRDTTEKPSDPVWFV